MHEMSHHTHLTRRAHEPSRVRLDEDIDYNCEMLQLLTPCHCYINTKRIYSNKCPRCNQNYTQSLTVFRIKPSILSEKRR